jgi:hypothetical protein
MEQQFKQQEQHAVKGLMSAFYSWLSHEIDTARAIPLSDFSRISNEVRLGDVLLIEGRSRISRIIRAVTLSPWTHAVFYMGRIADIEDNELRTAVQTRYPDYDSEQLVIESVLGKGTVLTPLKDYHKEHIRICRPRALTEKDAQQTLVFLLHRLGVDYSIRHILDLARFLFPWGLLPRRWRSSLFNHNADVPTKQICSSLIAEAFNSVKFPILPLIKKLPDGKIEFILRNPRLYTPSDFDYSPYFEVVKYPFIELSEHSVYRELPWNQEGLLSNDEEDLFIPPSH